MTGTSGARSSDYALQIGLLQRTELDALGGRLPPDEVNGALRTAIDLRTPLPLWLARIDSIPRQWQPAGGQEHQAPYLTEDVLAGLHGHGVAPYFVIRGEPARVRLYFGAQTATEGSALRALLTSQYPGVSLMPSADLEGVTPSPEREHLSAEWQQAARELQELRTFIAGCPHLGVVSGIPTPRGPSSAAPSTQLDRLIRGLYGRQWAVLVIASPEQDAALIDMQLSLQREQIRVEQEEGFREQRERGGQSVAAYYYRLLDMQHELLEACLYLGGWWTQVYVCAADAPTYQSAKALIKSVFAGDYGRVDRIRVLDCPGAGLKAASFSPILVERPQAPYQGPLAIAQRAWKYHTLLSSQQLAAWIHLPRVEVPGYHLREGADFDVASHVPPHVTALSLGTILDHGRPTGNAYHVPLEDLTRHALVVGITGSGKTNTIFHLLHQLLAQPTPVPFLVIEPAKREYRALAESLPPGTPLNVFTIGEEGPGSAPLRLNPLEIKPGVSVQTHINLLKSVFDAAFGMWTPLPQILERAIHEIYRDRGWDSVYSTNARAARADAAGMGWHSRAQPTLSDLAHKVAELVPALGYEPEVAGNIRTALETRLNSLRVGAKGMLLDTPRSVPIELLLREPTILELEGVGDDDERAFIMGLILVSLYEHYQVLDQSAAEGLLHLTVVEEAHRLLANVPAGQSPEAGNVRGKAVETFVNMLSEIRAYGEGFLIAEQIPTKLAPDVIKNTSLKVMHRLVASDDRQAMGGAMNLDGPQLRQVVALGTGTAAVHGGGRYGDDNAILIQVPRAKGGLGIASPGADVRQRWEHFRDRHGLAALMLPYPACSAWCQDGDRITCSETRTIAENPLVAEGLAALVTTLVAAGAAGPPRPPGALLAPLVDDLQKTIEALLPGRETAPGRARCIVTHALYRMLEQRGAQYGWDYADGDALIGALLPPLRARVSGQAVANEAQSLEAFCGRYAALCLRHSPPFHDCTAICGRPAVCLYRYGVLPLLNDAELSADLADAEPHGPGLAAACENAAEPVVAFGRLPLPGTDADRYAFQSAALCYLVQSTASDPSGWPPRNRRHAVESVLAHYGRPART